MVKMGTVWDRTVEFLSDHLGAIVPLALLAFFVPASITINLDVVIRQSPRALAIGLSVAELLLGLVSLWGTLAVIGLAINGPGANAAGLAGRRMPASILLAILLALAFVVLALPILGMLAAAGIDLRQLAEGGQAKLSAGYGWALALYLVAGLAVTLWVSGRLAVVNAALVHDGRPIRALVASWALTRGYALRLIGVLILFAVVAAVSRLAASTVFGSVFALLIGSDADGLSLSTVLTSIVTAAVQAAFMVLLAAFQGKLYVALVAHSTAPQGAIPA